MTNYIKLRKDDGGVPGNEVSEYGDISNPVEFTLRIDLSEEKSKPLWVTTASGFISVDTVADVSGANMNKWSLSLDDVTYSPNINLGTVYHSGIQFYVKAEATSDELPQKDYSVSINIEGIVEVE